MKTGVSLRRGSGGPGKPRFARDDRDRVGRAEGGGWADENNAHTATTT